MSTPYGPSLPRDGSGNVVQLPWAKPAIATNSITPTISSVLTFNANATRIEISAISQPAAFKWGSASVIATGATANLDHLVQPGSTRQFVIPVSVMGVSSIVGLNTQAGLYNSMAIIDQTSGSTVIVTQY